MRARSGVARGAPLRRERELRGWSQADVAERLGAPSPFHVSRWERGVVTPSPRYRERYCRLFGRTAVELGFVGTVELLGAVRTVALDLRAGPAMGHDPLGYDCPDCGRPVVLAEIVPVTGGLAR